MKRGTWEAISERDVPLGANIISVSFVITIKDVETESSVFKARFVAQGNRSKEKDLLVHDSTTVRPSSIRLLLALAAAMDFEVWTQDISKAYLQFESSLKREVYIRPTKQLKMPTGKVLNLLRPYMDLLTVVIIEMRPSPIT